MPFDEKLAGRIRTILTDRPHVVERRMFGGIVFMLEGHMCCGVVGDDLLVRVGVAGYEDAIARPHVRPMDFTGKKAKGTVFVAKAGVATSAALRAWISRGMAFVASLPKQ